VRNSLRLRRRCHGLHACRVCCATWAKSIFRAKSTSFTSTTLQTEVFGRSKTAFDAGEDAMRGSRPTACARTQRVLRHRGKESPHPTINFRQEPTFRVYPPGGPGSVSGGSPRLNRTERRIFERASEPQPPADRETSGNEVVRARPWSRGSQYALMAAVLLIAAGGVYWISHAGALANGGSGGGRSCSGHCAGVPASAAVAGAASLPIRILAGYTGEPQIDSARRRLGDRPLFHEGEPGPSRPIFIARTTIALLCEQWRPGDFFYDISPAAGRFTSSTSTSSTDRAYDNTSTFSVAINDTKVLAVSTVNSDAGAKHRR